MLLRLVIVDVVVFFAIIDDFDVDVDVGVVVFLRIFRIHDFLVKQFFYVN